MNKPTLQGLVFKLRELEYVDYKSLKSLEKDLTEIIADMIEDIRDIRLDLQLIILEGSEKKYNDSDDIPNSYW